MNKIALEEHVGTPELQAIRKAYVERSGFPGTLPPGFAAKMGPLLADIEEHRLPEMDRFGIAMQVLSISEPSVQKMDQTQPAVLQAAKFNDHLAEIVRKHPTRFAAFASVALQDPIAAASELRRAITQLGFKGAMIFGHTDGHYLDEPQFRPFWQAVAELKVPVYLHPSDPPADQVKAYIGYPQMLGASWNWGEETSRHALRLIFSGLFDELPSLTLILGHMGEMLPYFITRFGKWYRASGSTKPKRDPGEYLKTNVMITTTGVHHEPALRCAIDTLGAERVMFSVDYPFESNEEATRFIEKAKLSDEERRLICFENAQRLLRLTNVVTEVTTPR